MLHVITRGSPALVAVILIIAFGVTPRTVRADPVPPGNDAITPSAEPTRAGTDFFLVSDGVNPPSLATVSVSQNDINNGTAKVTIIARELTALGFKVHVVSPIGALNSSVVLDKTPFGTVPNGIAITTFKGVNNSNEQDFFNYFTPVASLSPAPQQGTLSFVGPLTGLNTNGVSSVFNASLNFQTPTGTNVLASSSLNYASLNNPTIGVLATDTYNALLAGLPSVYKPDLQLNQSDNTLTFNFPQNVVNPGLSAYTSDRTGFAFMSIASVPEPSTFVLSSLIATAASGCWWYRKIQRGSEIHCETSKPS